MPIPSLPRVWMPLPDDRAALDRMPGSKVPVIRQPYQAGDLLPYWAMGPFDGNHLYNHNDDPLEENNLAGSRRERDAADKLRQALQHVDDPADQFARLGLT